MLPLVEKYITLSGEAPIIGKPVYLVRFSGCNIDCLYCDTPYKNQVNFRITEAELIQDIKKQIREYPALAVLFTGGEPLLPERASAILGIANKLSPLYFYIETNGTLPLPAKKGKNCHYIVDWKAPSAGAAVPFAEENCRKLNTGDCIKIVVNKSDLEWVRPIIERIHKINPVLPVFLSPQWGALNLADLAEFILVSRLPVSLSPQLHKLIWGAEKRGV
jgi:7-carboxy-7-deazaguanine synthase